MKQDLQQLEKELIAAHQDLEMVTKGVEELESRKDYLLLGEQISQASQIGEGEEARKDTQMILFEKDCSQKFVISQEQIETIKQYLVIIIGQTKILSNWEIGLSTEGQKELTAIENHGLHINQIIEGLKKKENES